MSDDRSQEALTQFVLGSIPQLDFLALYTATVKAQNADLTLELVPDDSRIPSLSKVSIRHGIPGMTVKVSPNARVLLGFDGGNPSKPYAALWESGSVTELVLDGTTIKIGGTSAVQAAVQGDIFHSAFNTMLAALGVWVAAVGSGLTGLGVAPLGGATTTFQTALTALENAVYLSTTVKVK